MSNFEQLLLPEDVLIEILSWLPPETLMKFKRVCKSWYSTINDAKFIAKYESHFGHNYLVVATEKNSGTRSFSLQVRLLQEADPGMVIQDMELTFPNSQVSIYGYDVVSSCNGILCCAAFYLDDVPIQLCNPSIKWVHFVPPYRLENGFRFIGTDVHYGVGYDQFLNDYKIVKFNSSKTAIYSVKSKSWKRVDALLPRNIMTNSYPSVFLGGFIHWSAYTGTVSTSKRKIVSFDVCNEVFGEIQLPKLLNHRCFDNYTSSISVVKGSLCVLVAGEVIDTDEGIVCCIWTMKEYGVKESWINQLRVVYGGIIPGSVKLTVGGKILFSSYVDGSSRLKKMILLYDPDNNGYRNFGQVPSGDSVFSLVAPLPTSK